MGIRARYFFWGTDKEISEKRMVLALVKRVAVLQSVAATVAVLLGLLFLVDKLGRLDQELPDTLFGPSQLWAPC